MARHLGLKYLYAEDETTAILSPKKTTEMLKAVPQ
jgi:hypothetical protein